MRAMVHCWLLAAAALASAAASGQASDASDLPMTRLDRTFDRADRHLATASTYTCRNAAAERRWNALQERYGLLARRAEGMLRRQLNTNIRTAACRARYDERKFRYHAQRADYLLGVASRLIRRGETG